MKLNLETPYTYILLNLLIILLIAIYTKANYNCRIAIIIAMEAVIGLLGKFVWNCYDKPYIPIVAIIVTCAFCFFGKGNQEVLGLTFVLIMTTLIFVNTQTQKMPVVEKQENLQNKVETEDTDETAPNTIVSRRNSETTLISEDEIRETKQPIRINGYTHYYQNQYPDVYWPGGDGRSLPYNGCSITAMSDVLAYFNVSESPEDIVDYVNTLDNNYHKPEGGVYHEMFQDLTEYYNIPANCISDVDAARRSDVIKCMECNGIVISLQVEGEFTHNSHFIVICDYDRESETVTVLDPNLNNRGKEEERNFRYSLNEVCESVYSWFLFYPQEATIA